MQISTECRCGSSLGEKERSLCWALWHGSEWRRSLSANVRSQTWSSGWDQHQALYICKAQFGKPYITRDATRQDVFDYIEMFHNPTCKPTNNGILSPVDYEAKQKRMNNAGVWGTRLNARLSQSFRRLKATVLIWQQDAAGSLSWRGQRKIEVSSCAHENNFTRLAGVNQTWVNSAPAVVCGIFRYECSRPFVVCVRICRRQR